MPQVGNKKFPYTPKGMKEARAYAKKAPMTQSRPAKAGRRKEISLAVQKQGKPLGGSAGVSANARGFAALLAQINPAPDGLSRVPQDTSPPPTADPTTPGTFTRPTSPDPGFFRPAPKPGRPGRPSRPGRPPVIGIRPLPNRPNQRRPM